MTKVDKNKSLLLAISISALCTFAVFLFHFFFPSMINGYTLHPTLSTENIDFVYFEEIVQYHKTHPAFAARPVTSFFIEQAHQYLDLSYAYSFFLVNFSLLFIAGVLIFLLTNEVTGNTRTALISILTFFGTFTILFAFFESIYTYDEPAQYVMLLLALLAFFKKKHWFFIALGLYIAIVVRETSLLLLPAFLYLVVKHPAKEISYAKQMVLSALWLGGAACLALWSIYEFVKNAGYLAATQDYTTDERLAHRVFNFQNSAYAFETVVFVIAFVCVPLFAIFRSRWKKSTGVERSLIGASILTALINTPIVLLTARVREARLLVLPFIFLWPLFGMYSVLLFQYAKEKIIALRSQPKQLFLSLFGFLLLVKIGTLFFFSYFEPTASGNFPEGYQWYFFLEYLVVVFFAMIPWKRQYD